MSRFADLSLSAFLEAVARSEPTPGGGTASAIAGALGTSLLMMVAGLPRTRTGQQAETIALGEARAALTSLRDRLVAFADADADAFDQVMAAYRLPKGTEADQAGRKGAIQRALHGATAVPLDLLRAAVEAAKLARPVAAYGNASAASDVRVALELVEAAAAGAAANVETNLSALDDEAYRKACATDVVELTNRLTADAAAARAALEPKPRE